MLFVKRFGAVDGVIYIKTHLKGASGFSGFLDLSFFFMEEICHDVQKGSGYIPSSISYQKLAVSPAKNDKAIFFLDGNFFVYDIPLFPPKMHVSSVHYAAGNQNFLLGS